jgi:hypothetical protein
LDAETSKSALKFFLLYNRAPEDFRSSVLSNSFSEAD